MYVFLMVTNTTLRPFFGYIALNAQIADLKPVIKALPKSIVFMRKTLPQITTSS